MRFFAITIAAGLREPRRPATAPPGLTPPKFGWLAFVLSAYLSLLATQGLAADRAKDTQPGSDSNNTSPMPPDRFASLLIEGIRNCRERVNTARFTATE